MSIDEIERRLYADAAYVAVARTIGFATVYYSVLRPKMQALVAEFGEEKLRAAERDLLQSDPMPGSNWLVRLKPALRVRARQLLGPLPEESDEWNRGLATPTAQ